MGGVSGGYHYVEVMACPGGGCLNGGGQIKDAGANQSKERLELVTKIYDSVAKHTPDRHNDNDDVKTVYDDWLNDDAERINKYLHTEYHEVEKNVTSLNIKW